MLVRGELGELPVVAGRKGAPPGERFRLDEMKIVEQPLGSRRDGDSPVDVVVRGTIASRPGERRKPARGGLRKIAAARLNGRQMQVPGRPGLIRHLASTGFREEIRVGKVVLK